MANDRMYMVCVKCFAEEGASFKDCSLFMVKYYPSTGWGMNDNPETLGVDLEAFFNKHHHAAMDGNYLRLFYESDGAFNHYDPANKDRVMLVLRTS